MAARIARPVRALADRADEISESREGFRLLRPEGDEVTRLTVSFDRMLDTLQRSERNRASAERIAAWEQVARRIAHEVKNPLSPIQLAVENLRRTRERAPADLDRALLLETATILEEVASLRRLVDEFSQFARLPRPTPAPCDPRQLAEQALALYSARISGLGVAVVLDAAGAPGRIVADPEQVGRVFKNVLANALDALEGVTDRRLSVTLRRDTAGSRACVVAEFRDTGVGLDPEAARQIFEPYFTTRAERGGTGLGMAIAYRIVADHGGSIEASGARGLGATVTIRLPEDGPPAGAA
jgi:nitrogen fixation/metabolism regulation signal transduction histidine kinase